MTHKERFLAAVRFQTPDMPALDYYYTDVGYAEHGEKLQELYRRYPGDTAPVPELPAALPGPAPEDILPDGSYHRRETDAWGTTWEYRIYGRMGHAVEFPLLELGRLDDYAFPPMPLEDPATLAALRARVAAQGNEYPIRWGIPGLLEHMIALRPFDEVLMDMALEDEALVRLADRLTEHFAAEVQRAVDAGADVISMGDDYGTERALLMAPALWRRFFFPRIQRILAPAKAAGRLCCFHSCGWVWDILPDLREAGADSIWLQLPLYDMDALAERLRALHLALCIHVDRGELMQNGSPADVTRYVDRVYRTFRPDQGGAWFYFEVDQGFPFDNIQALAQAIHQYRTGAI